VHLHSDVRKPRDATEALLISVRRLRICRDNRHGHGRVARAETPDVQVRDTVSADLQPLPQGLFQVLVGDNVEKSRAGSAQKAES
jgi:hypothetical protein